MTLEETEKRLKELLGQGASQEEMIKQLSLADGCGLKLWCQEQIVAGSAKKVHRWCGYVIAARTQQRSVPEPLYGKWIDGGSPET
jgi:hypothetical protein